MRFSKVKLWADCVEGIKTVCTVPNNGTGELMFPEQLAMKINHQAGGQNYIVAGLDSLLKDDACLVLGVSVSQPSPSSKIGCPAVTAVVGHASPDFL